MAEVVAQVSADISISVVSHSQIVLVAELLNDLALFCRDLNIEFILTLNLMEKLPFSVDKFPYPIKVIRNVSPLGFGANHNQAFRHATGLYFCVINPDIRLSGNPFCNLIRVFADSTVGVAAPLVLGGDGAVEDSARHFPSPLKILCKAIGGCGGSDYVINTVPIYPDWVGGMFMLFPRHVFEQLHGFDERYFLYYEDVNLCGRLRLLDYKVALHPSSQVVHHARRSSHRNLQYLHWHLSSMMRFFLSSVYWRLLFQCAA